MAIDLLKYSKRSVALWDRVRWVYDGGRCTSRSAPHRDRTLSAASNNRGTARRRTAETAEPIDGKTRPGEVSRSAGGRARRRTAETAEPIDGRTRPGEVEIGWRHGATTDRAARAASRPQVESSSPLHGWARSSGSTSRQQRPSVNRAHAPHVSRSTAPASGSGAPGHDPGAPGSGSGAPGHDPGALSCTSNICWQ